MSELVLVGCDATSESPSSYKTPGESRDSMRGYVPQWARVVRSCVMPWRAVRSGKRSRLHQNMFLDGRARSLPRAPPPIAAEPRRLALGSRGGRVMKTVQIDRKQNLTPEDFIRDHLQGVGQPVIITDAIQSWPAFAKWTFDYFKESYGSDF